MPKKTFGALSWHFIQRRKEGVWRCELRRLERDKIELSYGYDTYNYTITATEFTHTERQTSEHFACLSWLVERKKSHNHVYFTSIIQIENVSVHVFYISIMQIENVSDRVYFISIVQRKNVSSHVYFIVQKSEKT